MEITLNPNLREAAELDRLIQMRAGWLKEDIRESVLWAIWFIARSAAASTVQSPSRRKVVPNPLRGAVSATGKKIWSAFAAIRTHAAAKPGGKFVTDRSGTTYIPIDADSIGEARKSKAAKIKRKGLAKMAWGWMVANARRSGMSALGLSKWTRVVEVEHGNDDSNPSVTMHNRLTYASLALKGDKVDSILSRGINSFRKDLNRRAKISIEGRL